MGALPAALAGEGDRPHLFSAILTAVANDDDFKKVFVRQLEANARAGMWPSR